MTKRRREEKEGKKRSSMRKIKRKRRGKDNMVNVKCFSLHHVATLVFI